MFVCSLDRFVMVRFSFRRFSKWLFLISKSKRHF
jgi:hypothetical protein